MIHQWTPPSKPTILEQQQRKSGNLGNNSCVYFIIHSMCTSSKQNCKFKHNVTRNAHPHLSFLNVTALAKEGDKIKSTR
jgi:hypothetical protein